MKTYTKKTNINVAPEVVYKAFTEPTHIRNWYEGNAQIALRTHGHFTIADDTGDVYESGEYLEIKPNSLLRYKMEHHGFYLDSEVRISFSDKSAQTTEVFLEHTNLKEEDCPHISAKWDFALQNLKSYLEEGRTQKMKYWLEANRHNYKL